MTEKCEIASPVKFFLASSLPSYTKKTSQNSHTILIFFCKQSLNSCLVSDKTTVNLTSFIDNSNQVPEKIGFGSSFGYEGIFKGEEYLGKIF